jgi:hypothetical protein
MMEFSAPRASRPARNFSRSAVFYFAKYGQIIAQVQG